MKPELDNQNVHRYMRVYNYYRELILSGQMAGGSRLPSIRRCAAELQMSRTTVETAYMVLAAEGYIISRPQSGFYVTDIRMTKQKTAFQTSRKTEARLPIRYDFASANVDRKSFQFDLWRRYVKSALRQDERLLSYGEPQGEQELREVLCRYLQNNRNVICTPEHIVVGAGIQSLLHILCPLMKERNKVAFQNPQFKQGRAVFLDHGFELAEKLEGSDSDIYYVSPSQITAWGEVMHVQQRMELIRGAYEKNILIIEDDYNSEFRYYHHPTPSIQGLSGGKGVVYLGTFSRMLLPSIRMSFMVLPPELVERYEKRKELYNQTASKAEQIALCQFIRDGHLESQIRKSRKLYQAKTKALCKEVKRVFGEKAEVNQGEAGFMLLVTMKSEKSAEELVRQAKKAGIAILAAPHGEKKGNPQIMLSCAGLDVEQYPEALQELYNSVSMKEGETR